MMDNNLEKTNYNSILAGLSVNNFVTNFEYIEEWIIVYDGSKITDNPKIFKNP